MFNIEAQGISTQLERFGLAHAALSRETNNWLVDMAMWTKDDLKRRVPVKSGTLKNSLRYELEHKSNGGEASFHAVWYGKELDEGIRSFTITAQPGKPMAFFRGGDRVFAMTVNHPGVKARHWTVETLEAAHPEADRQMDAISERIYRTVM